MSKKMQKGMTLMSVMVATALSGIVGLMVIRLMSNQAEAMLIVKLREEREILIKHYRKVIIGGWDKTMAGGASTVYTRGGNTIPSTGLILKSDDLYRTTSVSGGWWKVKATIGSKTSGKIQHSDVYDSSGSGLATEQNYTVTLKIEFDPKEHPVVKMKLADRAEVIYMGYRWQTTKQSGCGSDSAIALTRRDTTGTTPLPLYHPNSQGAVVSYSFHSNYIKCSQVPLIRNADRDCPPVGAILGFESKSTGVGAMPTYRRNNSDYVTGRLACSYPHEDYPSANYAPGSAWKAALGTERYYTLRDKVWDNTDIANTSTRSGSTCPSIDKSYIDFVTAISNQGTGGGELVCESTLPESLIAPQVFRHYYSGNTRINSVPSTLAGSALGSYTFNRNSSSQPGPLNNCIQYLSSYNGTNNNSYNDHVGDGGYDGDHSGGLTNFTSTGSGEGARTDPFNRRYNSRGVPGNRGDPGECKCPNP